MDESDEEKSWSFVDEQDARDQIPRLSSAESFGQGHEGDTGSRRRVPGSGELGSFLSHTGNESPSRPVTLEAVDSSPAQQPTDDTDSSSSTLSTTPSPNRQFQDLKEPGLAVAAQTAAPQTAQSEDVEGLQQQHGPSTVSPRSDSATSDSLYAPQDLPPLHTSPDHAEYSYSDEDDMSQSSSNTAVMVENPCSDEEDNAERRWRLGVQRQDDIRRAQAPPCPRAEGTERFLKVVVVGEAGLGKTTFIQNLQATFQSDLPSPKSSTPEQEPANLYEVFKKSPEDLCTEVTINTDASRFHYLLQDTPGLIYGQTNVRVPAHISKQNKKYLEREQDPQRTQPMHAGPDHRVDACLFFINPNHLKDAEVTAMIQISELVPVVPMIAKADIFVPSELAAFRLLIQKRLAEEEAKLGRPIIWRPTHATAPADAEEEAQRLQPPFAVIASSHTDLAVGRFWPVRSYQWGRCEALSSANSDLAILKRLLFEEGFATLKRGTEERYYKFRTAHLTEVAARQADTAAPEATEEVAEAEEANGDNDGLPDEESAVGEGSDVEDAEEENEDQEYISSTHATVGDPRPAERRKRRNFWMWGIMLTSIVCTAVLGSVSQLEAEKRDLQSKLQEQAQGVMQPEVKPAAHSKQANPFNPDKKKNSLDDGSQCTKLISSWRYASSKPETKHTRKHSSTSATINETTLIQSAELQEATGIYNVAKAVCKSDHLSQALADQLKSDYLQPQELELDSALVLHNPPFLFRTTHKALQSVGQAATAVGRLSAQAQAHSLAVVQHANRQAKAVAAAAANAVAMVVHDAAEKAAAVSHRAGVVVYQGVNSSCKAFVHAVHAAQRALSCAQQTLATGIRTFGDVTEASRMKLQHAPAAARQMQHGLTQAGVEAMHAVRQIGQVASQKLDQVSAQVVQVAHQSVHRLQTSKISKWDARMWMRFAARLGVLGAAL